VGGEPENALGLTVASGEPGGGALEAGEALPRSLAQSADDFDLRCFHGR
jgi:hypothetical protein